MGVGPVPGTLLSTGLSKWELGPCHPEQSPITHSSALPLLERETSGHMRPGIPQGYVHSVPAVPPHHSPQKARATCGWPLCEPAPQMSPSSQLPGCEGRHPGGGDQMAQGWATALHAQC